MCYAERVKAFSLSLAGFTPLLMHSSSLIAERLELFRTQTLLPLEPIDKKTQAANDEINQMIDSTLALGIDSVPVVDLPPINSRAGLYVYLHSIVRTLGPSYRNSLINRRLARWKTSC
jgi:mediator of RNA polymerase II transcription subunit 5